jgi:protein-S-isoprenylcysteine O-methyltransferase Ste14
VSSDLKNGRIVVVGASLAGLRAAETLREEGFAGELTMVGRSYGSWRSSPDLGRNWSLSLQIRNEHRLVTTGIYGFVRHPMYSSFFLLAIAQIMLLPNWFAGAAGLVGVGVLYAFRIRQEERMMLERFGADYERYMAHTARLIPWISADASHIDGAGRAGRRST